MLFNFKKIKYSLPVALFLFSAPAPLLNYNLYGVDALSSDSSSVNTLNSKKQSPWLKVTLTPLIPSPGYKYKLNDKIYFNLEYKDLNSGHLYRIQPDSSNLENYKSVGYEPFGDNDYPKGMRYYNTTKLFHIVNESDLKNGFTPKFSYTLTNGKSHGNKKTYTGDTLTDINNKEDIKFDVDSKSNDNKNLDKIQVYKSLNRSDKNTSLKKDSVLKYKLYVQNQGYKKVSFLSRLGLSTLASNNNKNKWARFDNMNTDGTMYSIDLNHVINDNDVTAGYYEPKLVYHIDINNQIIQDNQVIEDDLIIIKPEDDIKFLNDALHNNLLGNDLKKDISDAISKINELTPKSPKNSITEAVNKIRSLKETVKGITEAPKEANTPVGNTPELPKEASIPVGNTPELPKEANTPESTIKANTPESTKEASTLDNENNRSVRHRSSYKTYKNNNAITQVSNNINTGSINENFVVDRVYGKDRIDTAIEVSKKYYKNADTVIIASASNGVDALNAATLSAKLKAPILLSYRNSLSKGVVDEIHRLNAKNIILIGGYTSLSNSISSNLREMNVSRISGNDRYDTSLLIAKEVGYDVNSKSINKVILVNGDKFSDAISVSSYAIKNNLPIFMIKNNFIWCSFCIYF